MQKQDIENRKKTKKDYTEEVYIAWQYLGVVVIVFVFLKLNPWVTV